jgi:hypothetical protein
VAGLTATGAIDTTIAQRVSDLLWPRLLTEPSIVVLDLRGVTFVGMAELELITAARTYAPYRHLGFVVLGSPTAVERALCAGGFDASGPATPRETQRLDPGRSPSRLFTIDRHR